MSVHSGIAREVWEWPATGTTWRIHHSGRVDALAARRVAELVERDEARWSRFRPGSDVSLLSAAAGAWVQVSPETFELLELGELWGRRTGRLFQPLVGVALAAWGYSESLVDTPAFAEISPSGGRIGGRVEIDPAASCARIPAGTALDLGGIAKSHMAVRAGRALAAMTGEPALLVDAGGDLVAVRGDHIVAVERPGPAPLNRPGARMLEPVARIRLQAGHGVATSGYGRRRWRNGDGVDAHHLIDPGTGRPGPQAHATVLAADPVQADVTAKCLALRPALLRQLDLPAAVTVGGTTRFSPAWKDVLA
jgi:thiamine biosynthesis lipoprotein